MQSASVRRTLQTRPAPIGRRVHVIGISASGKSTLAARLATALDADFVELDALNWLPDWVGLNETNPAELERRFRCATRGDAWVAAGSYAACSQRAFWPRLDTVVWLDLPMPLLLWRVLRRSWRRWRRRELLWGTNVERFWPQLALWRGDESLVYWIVTAHARKRRAMHTIWPIRAGRTSVFVRLRSVVEVNTFANAVESVSRP